MWTDPTTWKVKRIRRNSDVTLQANDARGRPKVDEVFAGTATVLDADGTQWVRDLVSRKYGIIETLVIKLHKLFRGADGSIGLAVTQELSRGE